VDPGDRVVAGVIAIDMDGRPWVAEVFRQPGPRHAGLGSLVLRRVLAGAAAAGVAEIGLTVTHGNPALRVYERLGFDLASTTIAILIP